METKWFVETENSIQEFTVQFYGGTVMIEQNQLPLGQISCELLIILWRSYLRCMMKPSGFFPSCGTPFLPGTKKKAPRWPLPCSAS